MIRYCSDNRLIGSVVKIKMPKVLSSDMRICCFSLLYGTENFIIIFLDADWIKKEKKKDL